MGPNPEAVPGRGTPAPANQPPAPLPFYPSIALFIGAVVATWVFRRRKGSVDSQYVEGPIDGPEGPRYSARTMDSLPRSSQWEPNPAEVEWLQAFFGIDEEGYGPLTKEAVVRLQKRHIIDPDPDVMIGPKTYRALWEEHLNLVHERWKALAEGREPVDLDRVLDSPMPPDLREEMIKLNDDYKGYWAAVEGRYQAILRRDPLLVSGYEEQIDAFQTAGLELGDIQALKDKYQPAIDALYQQAEKVKNDPDDGEYAKLLAMLDAADQGRWDEITSTKATLGGRWDALWSSDKSETKLGEQVLSFLGTYTTVHLPAKSNSTEGLNQVLLLNGAEPSMENKGATNNKPSISEEPFDPQWPVQRKIDYWKPHAMEAQEKTGIPWQVILAQFGLESGYGRFVPPGSNNAFGITADDETDPAKYVEADTVEGSGSARRRKFRKYSSFAESFEDHNDVLLQPRYSEAMNHRADPYQYLAMIWVGNVTEGYATDPYYLEKVGAIIYRLETGKEATVEYRTDNNSKLGGAITHVIPTGDFLNTLRDRVYNNPKVKEAMMQRHRRLYVQSQRQPVLSWDYPKKVFMGGEFVDVTN